MTMRTFLHIVLMHPIRHCKKDHLHTYMMHGGYVFVRSKINVCARFFI